jgi:uncharacterized protein with PQ loop repeat
MVEHVKYQNVAVISSILTIVAFSYLVFKVYKTGETEHLTFIWLFIILSAQLLLFIYGFSNGSRIIYLQALFILIGLMYILYIKLNNLTNAYIETDLRTKKIIT